MLNESCLLGKSPGVAVNSTTIFKTKSAKAAGFSLVYIFL